MSLVVSIFLIFGSLFIIVAGLGIVRFPDIYSRMHASTKAGAFGSCLLLIVCVLNFWDIFVTIEVVMIVGFYFLTAPVGAQMISRAAYLNKAPQYGEPKHDALAANYDKRAECADLKTPDEPGV